MDPRRSIAVCVAALAAGVVGVCVGAWSFGAGAAPSNAAPPAPAYDQPQQFRRSADAFDFDEREEMIAMRDGVRLKTFILVPRNARNAPILLSRTPYNAAQIIGRVQSPHLASIVPQMFDTAASAGYILVFQDVRGKFGSEGNFVMTRPLRGPFNTSPSDDSTDAYDIIEWLVEHVRESNGRVGIIGGSYAGFTTVISTVHPHPALKVIVPFAPIIDGWIGDDWFHNGAFREDDTLTYIYRQEATRQGDEQWWTGMRDTYQAFLNEGSAGAMASSHGMNQLEFWRVLTAHTAYDAFWQQEALDKVLAKQPLSVPMLIVCGLFDQEDLYGGTALYRALAPRDPAGDRVHLVLGPGNHAQGRTEGRGIGPIVFEGDTAGWFRRSVMQPFLDHYLKDGPKPDTPRVLAYETGADRWRRYDDWPRACSAGCALPSRTLYLRAGGKLRFDGPSARKAGDDRAAYDEYVSDPAKPVPYRATRPTLMHDAAGSTWGEWLVDDQRNAASRPDVLVYVSDPLDEPLRVAGIPVAHLFASTSGSDADWVVKIIDVWPDEMPNSPLLGGYQQMLSADIFRGRYREDLALAHPIPANKVLPYRIPLPNVSHTFLSGHRIMIQIQSTWFPLYDRNPQTFVPNIMFAEPKDYVKATQRIWRSSAAASAVELPVIGRAEISEPGCPGSVTCVDN